MAQRKKRSFFDRLLVGSEKSEGYARASLPSNRWELYWDILKGRFWRLVLINLLILLFCVPLILVLFFRYVVVTGYGGTYPFSQPFGLGYMAPPDLLGYAEQIVFNAASLVYLFFPIALMIAGIGLAGGAYIMRNMVWTEGIFVANDFWRGIKSNIKKLLLITFLYGVIFYLSMISASYSDYMIAVGKVTWLFTISKIVTYVALALFTMMALHMMSMTVTYELKFRQLLKNAYIFTTRLIFHNVFFIFLMIIPVLLFIIGGIVQGLGLVLILLVGMSNALLIWTDYSQWIYDKFINDKIKGAKKNRGIYSKIKNSDSESLKKYKEQVASSFGTLNSKPIKPITDDDITIAELPVSFNRDDILKLNESKKAMAEDHEKYVAEHINDEKYAEYRALKQEMNSDEQEKQKRIDKAKKALSKRNKKK